MLLLMGGILLGPEGLGLVDPALLGHGLEPIISLAVAIILFEGGLTLDLQGYREAPVVIKRLLTIGPLVTWLGTSFAVYALFNFEPTMALMAGSLVIVTGPTVVSPLLRRLGVRERLHHVLYWEGVLIDAIGVFVAVLCYEWLTPHEAYPMMQPIASFALRVAIGSVLGIVVGFAVATALKNCWIPKDHGNLFVLAAALLTFAGANAVSAESGILAVVIAGLIVGLKRPPQLKTVKHFKLQLTDLGIGTLFILLSAQLELSRFSDWRLVGLLAILIFILRPVTIWLATWGRQFETREKVFLSWIAPRGIVAAAMASLFSIRLQEAGYANAQHLETFTYAVIASTVTIQGLSAPWVVHFLRLKRKDQRKWILFGEKALVEPLLGALRQAGVPALQLATTRRIDDVVNPDDPRFSDAKGIICANTSIARETWSSLPWNLGHSEDTCYRWRTTGPKEDSNAEGKPAGREVWQSTVKEGATAEALASGKYSIEVVEIDERNNDVGRFGPASQPLFWVSNGDAHLIADPLNPGPPEGDMAIVLHRRLTGLAHLVDHIELIDQEGCTFQFALNRMASTIDRRYPKLPTEQLVRGIQKRRETMPAAIGGGIAIPHTYCDNLTEGICLLAVVPKGVIDMVTPDDLPVRFLFLLISPLGKAPKHLESLAAIAALGQEPEFMDLLSRQRVPARLARLLTERS